MLQLAHNRASSLAQKGSKMRFKRELRKLFARCLQAISHTLGTAVLASQQRRIDAAQKRQLLAVKPCLNAAEGWMIIGSEPNVNIFGNKQSLTVNQTSLQLGVSRLCSQSNINAPGNQQTLSGSRPNSNTSWNRQPLTVKQALMQMEMSMLWQSTKHCCNWD